MDTLKALMRSQKEGSVRLKEKNIEGIQRIRIHNLNLHLYIRQISDNEYTIDSFFKFFLPTTYANNGEKPFNTSQFAMLSVEDFILSSNIDYKRIEKETKLFDDEDHYEQIRHMMLRMLCAYDIKPSEELLNSSTRIARKLNRIETCKGCKTIDLINVIQCNLRKRSITKKEKQTLKAISQDENTALDIRTAAYLLMGNYEDAKKCYDRLNCDEKEAFDQYPINRFWDLEEQRTKYLQDYSQYVERYKREKDGLNDWWV